MTAAATLFVAVSAAFPLASTVKSGGGGPGDRGRGIELERTGARRCGVGGVCFEGGGVRGRGREGAERAVFVLKVYCRAFPPLRWGLGGGYLGWFFRLVSHWRSRVASGDLISSRIASDFSR